MGKLRQNPHLDKVESINRLYTNYELYFDVQKEQQQHCNIYSWNINPCKGCAWFPSKSPKR